MNKAFIMKNRLLINVASLVLEDTIPAPLNDMFDIPFIAESDNKFDILLATLH